MPTPFTLQFNLTLENWQRGQETSARRASGKSSLNVSKATAMAIQELANKLAALGRVALQNVSYYGVGKVSPDELLAALAGGALTLTASSTKKRPARKAKKKTPGRKHASKRSWRGMPRRRPRTKHARQPIRGMLSRMARRRATKRKVRK